MDGSGDTLLGTGRVEKTLPKVRDGSEDPPKGSEWVGGPFRRSVTDLRILPKVRDGSGDPPKNPGRVGGPFRRFGTGWWTIPEVRDGLGDTFGGPGRVGRPSRRLPDLLDDLSTHLRPSEVPLHPSQIPERVPQPVTDPGRTSQPVPHIPEDLPICFEPPRGSHDWSWTSRRVPQPVPELREGPPTCTGTPGGSPNPSRTFGRVPRPVPDLWEGPPPVPDLQ